MLSVANNALSASVLGLFLKPLLPVATFFWLFAVLASFVCSHPLLLLLHCSCLRVFAMNCPSDGFPADFTRLPEL